MSYIIKRHRQFRTGSRQPWSYACQGIENKYRFLPQGHWECKYRRVEAKTAREAKEIIAECQNFFPMPKYEYFIEEVK